MIGWKINDGIDRQEGRVARDTRWQRSCLIIPCRSLRHVIMSTSSKLFMCPWLRAPSGSWGERLLPHLLFLGALPWRPNDTSALHEHMIWLGKQEQWGKGAGEGDGHKMKDSPGVQNEKKSNKGSRSQLHQKHRQREDPYQKLPISKTGRLFSSNLGANCLTAEIN